MNQLWKPVVPVYISDINMRCFHSVAEADVIAVSHSNSKDVIGGRHRGRDQAQGPVRRENRFDSSSTLVRLDRVQSDSILRNTS